MTPLTMFDQDEGPLIDLGRSESVGGIERDQHSGSETDEHGHDQRDAAAAGLRHSPTIDGAEHAGDENQAECDVELS